MLKAQFFIFDQICLQSFLYLVFRYGRSSATVFYFEAKEGCVAIRLYALFKKLGLVTARLQKFDKSIGQVKNDQGCCEYIRLYDDARQSCKRIRKEFLAEDPFINALGLIWQKEKVCLYFERQAERWLVKEFLRIGLVSWWTRSEARIESNAVVLLVKRDFWFPNLREYAVHNNVQLNPYGVSWDFVKLGKIIKRTTEAIKRVFLVLVKMPQSLFAKLQVTAQPTKEKNIYSAGERIMNAPNIALHNYHRTLSMEPTDRSGLFWLGASGIPLSQAVVYGYLSSEPLNEKIRVAFRQSGLRLYGKGPDVSSWLSGWRVVPFFLKFVLKIIKGALRCLIRGKRTSCYFLFEAVILAFDFSYWHDFFSRNHVLINITPDNVATVGQVLALDELGGVSISYQYSVSNIVAPTTALVAGENVQFIFSSFFRQLRQNMDPQVDCFVNIGFVYGHAQRLVRNTPRIQEVKEQLHANGARFVLCFFDENSLNRWDIRASHDDAADDYRFLLKWLLADSTLGIVFKPKRSIDLFERIGSTADLLEQARMTGRCIFLTSDSLVGSMYPAEAALMADVAIGLLNGATACLESFLAGVPTVLIDTTSTLEHPFHSWGRGNVVFDDWQSLRHAVEQYRNDTDPIPGFGDWTPALHDLDPFQDGEAALRMGSFIRWVFEVLKGGETKNMALVYATQKFEERWGRNHTVSLPTINT